MNGMREMSGMSWRCKPFARTIVWCNCWMMIATAPVHAAPPPRNALPQSAANWIQAGSATQTISGNTLTIDQRSNKAILNWESFNIGSDAAVQFNQPSASSTALNRIHDSSPSQIFGRLGANGNVYLINQNGIVFGNGAQVNVRGLIASTLDITNEKFLEGTLGSAITNGQAIVEGGGNGTAVDLNSRVVVEAGATIKTETGGQVLMFAPTVENHGNIETPDGQTLLAASKNKVYLVNSDRDSDLRGLLVEVDTGGDVANVGNIVAERGNITLLGLAVNQNGRVRATTSVDVNGSVRLVARDGANAESSIQTNKDKFVDANFLGDASEITQTAGAFLPIATRTGKVTLGQGSVTEVVADSSGKTATDSAAQPQSRIQMMGETITLKNDALIKTPAGQIDLVATKSLVTIPAPGTISEGEGRIYLGENSRIDVSGEDVVLPASRRVIEVELRGDELKDAPLQRNGKLRGQKVNVDINRGSPLIADLSPWLARVQKGASERMTQGGTVNLLAAGDVVMAQNAGVNIAGGSITYEAGLVNTTRLLSRGGIVDIGDASPHRVYDAVLGEYTLIHPKWGKRVYGRDSVFARGTFEEAYTDGAQGGFLNIETPTLYGFDLLTLNAHVQQGSRQRAENSVPGASRVAIDVRSGNDPSSKVQNVVMNQLRASIDAAADDELPLQESGRPLLNISAAQLNRSGVGDFRVSTYGDLRIAADTELSLTPAAAFTASAKTIAVDGRLRLPGGTVRLMTAQPDKILTDVDAQFPLVLGARSLIDVSGVWTNDQLAAAQKRAQTDPLALDGGIIELMADGDLTIAAGAQLKADAGAQLTSPGSFVGGDGGAITLISAPQTASNTGARLSLPEGAVTAYGFGSNGSLALEAGRVVIGRADADPLTLALAGDFFSAGGFGKYEVRSNLRGLDVADNTRLDLGQRNFVLRNPQAAAGLASGGDLHSITTIASVPAAGRAPVDLTLSSARKPSSSGAFTDMAPLRIGTGSAIRGEPGARIVIGGDDSIFIDGTIDAPGGSIAVALNRPGLTEVYRPELMIWFGENARLLAPATSTLIDNAEGLLLRKIHDAGAISVRADRGAIVAAPGSAFDVSGAGFALDVPRYVANKKRDYTLTTRHAAAGSVDFTAAEALLVYSDLKGTGSGDGFSGSLAFRLDRNNRSVPADGTPFPFADLIVDLYGELPAWGGWNYGAALPEAVRSRAIVGADRVAAGGFGSLALGAANLRDDRNGASTSTVPGYGVVRAASDIAPGALLLRDTLQIDAAEFDANGRRVALAAGSFLFGQDDNGNAQAGIAQRTRAPVAGTGVLDVEAGFIELLGNLSLTRADRAHLASTGDIRLRAQVGIDSNNGNQERILAPATLQTAGDLHLQAAQIYPATLTDYTFRLGGAGSVFRTSASGGARAPILSAGGTLRVLAPQIEHGGTLAAPLGQILLGNAGTQSIALLTGSALDVSATTLIPFGRLRGDIDWIYPILATAPLVIDAVPDKRVELQADAIDMQAGARIEVSGGGDITAFEFIAGPGGSRDFLETANAKGGFAVVPWLNSAVAPYDAIEMAGSGIAAGQTIYLEGGNGLAAGNYAVLPPHYALLPGAYLITPTLGDWNPGKRTKTLDGTVIAAGRFGRAFSAQYASEWTGYAIETGDAARLRSQYTEAVGNDYFAAGGVSRARDAGQVVVDADTALRLDGVIGAQSQNGRGALLDIVADVIEVVETAAGDSGAIQLAADALNALGVDSLLLGGRRARTGDDTAVAVSANSVAVRDGANLAVPDLILAARDSVQLDAGVRISGTGQSQVDTNRFVLSGDGAFLRASTGAQADVMRTGTAGVTGNLVLSAGSAIAGARSVLADATADTALNGALGLAQGSLNLTANRISLGGAPAHTAGVVFDAAELAALNASELRLSSRSTIDFYGSLSVASDNLQLNAGALRSLTNSDVTVSGAGTLQLGNAANVQNADAANAGGTLRLAGSRIELGSERDNGTSMALRGFDRVELGAAQTTREIVGQGVFTLNAGGAVALTGDRLTVASRGNASIVTSGNVTTARASTDAVFDPAAPGGRLAITANRIDHGGVIDLSGGVLELIASGAGADAAINLLDGSQINVSGRSIAAPEGWVSSSAGKVTLRSDSGSVTAAAGAGVNLDGGAYAGDAGSLIIKAPNGAVNWLAATSARAAAGSKGGSIELTKNNLADIDQWLGLIGASGFDQTVHLRSRGGDVAINANARAADFAVSADNGSLLLNSAIDARGEKGGHVTLHAGNDLALTGNARVDASATSADGRGGRVELGAGQNQTGPAGRLSLPAGSAIDVAGGSAGRDGRVHLRAPRVNGDTDVAIDIASGAAITGAEAVVAEAFRTYDSSVIDTAFMAGVFADAAAFMANGSAVAQRLNATGVSLRPGIEVRSGGDISIMDTIDFAAVRYGADAANRIPGDPGVLTLRAAGDVIFTGSLRDGLVAETDPAGVDAYGNPLIGLNLFTGIPNMLLLPGESWQYRVAAGADLAAADPLTVRDGEGNLRLQSGADVITGAADIRLVAGDSVISDLVDSVVASLGLSAYREQSAGLIDPSIDLGGWLPDTGTIESWILAWGYGYKRLLYPEQGGDVSIRAGADIRFAKAEDSGQQEHFFTDWMARLGGDDLALAQVPGLTSAPGLTTWGIFASYFHYGDQWHGGSAGAQGVAVLGGGDLSLAAGRDIVNLNAALPTTGKQVGTVSPGAVLPRENAVEVLGGGSLYARAGRDIVAPRILVDKGQASLFAGGNISNADGLNALVVLGDAQLNASAVGDVTIGAVLDSTTLPQSELLNTTPGSAVALENYFFSYTDASRVSLTSTAGDVALVNEAAAMREAFGSRFAASDVYARADGTGNDNLWMLLPGSLDVYALSGSIGVSGAVSVFPSSSGTLHLFAGRDIRFDRSNADAPGLLRMADVPLALLPFRHNPVNTWFDEGSPQQGIFASGAAARLFSTNVAPLTFGLAHADDPQHNWITALGGDIDGFNAALPKQTRIYAGRDVIDANIDLQHASQHSVSEIVAGRDIAYTLTISRDGALPSAAGNPRQIKVSGPGRLDVIAGRDIGFGVTPGIESVGNSLSSNFAMADSGADITLMAGINQATAVTSDALYHGFAQRYFTATDLLDTSYIDWFAAGNFGGDAQKLVSVFTGQAYADTAAAIDAFNALPVSLRQTIGLEAYQLHKAGAQAAASATGYAAAGGHRPAYSAELVDFVGSARFAGDLTRHVSAVTGAVYANNGDAAIALAALPAAQQHGIARAAIDAAPSFARRELVLDILVAEVRKGGIENANGFLNRNADPAGFERSNRALQSVFPGDGWQGDLQLVFSALKSYDDGDINIFTPGGRVDVGLAGSFAGLTKGADKLGIVSLLYGAINILASGDINVNASRIFSLDGAAVTLWSGAGDIDAGKGAKTAASVPPPEFRLQDDGTIETLFPPGLTGSGIQALSNDYKTATDPGPFQTADVPVERQRYFRSLSRGNAYLFAPQGVVDAGDAGIALSGDLLIAAQAVVGADNISVGGVSIGVPTTASVSAGTLSMGNTAASATESATSSMNEAIRQTAVALAESKVAFVTVDVIGVGR